jgi:hypothetical protein
MENLADYQSKHQTVLFTQDKFPLWTSRCNKAKHSESVCWNSTGWVRT